MKPYSLVRRLTALVVAVSLVALAFNAALFFLSLQNVGRDMVDKWASQVRIVTAVLREAAPAAREQLARTMSVAPVSVSRQPPASLGAPQWTSHHLPPELRDALQAALSSGPGPGVRVLEALDAAGVAHTYAMARIGDETWWVGYPTPGPPVAQMILTPLGMLGLIGLSAAITLFIGLRLITRPMSQLADEVLARSGDLRPIDAPARVSVELQQIIHAFNALVGALRVTEQMRKHLMAGISHDLRTPLARLRLRAELHAPDPIFEAMEQDIDAVLHIVDQFMRHAQGRGADSEIWQQPVACVLQQVVQQYQALHYRVALTRLDDSRVQVDSLNVQRVLGNLIDNALAHGCPPVDVALHEVPEGIELWVCDHGPGFAHDALALATRPFARLGEDASKPGHFGLGLSIVDQIARKLGGEIVLRPFDGQRFGIGIRLPHAGPAPH